DDPEAGSADDLADRLDQHLRETVLPELAEAIGEDLDPVRALGVRVVLRGNVADRMAWREACDALESTASGAVRGMTDIEWSHRGTTFFVEKLELNAQQAVDLVELARDDTYPGLLARRLVALERMDEEGDALLERAEAAAGSFGRVSGAGNPPTPAERREELRQHLLRAGRDALDELLAQGQRLQPSAAVVPQPSSDAGAQAAEAEPQTESQARPDASPQGEAVETEEANA
ncbi:MAG: hypothetical protein ACYS26_13155, partial [Planctomycetota bacterium]